MFRNWEEEVGKPCRRSILGPVVAPAERLKMRMPDERVVNVVVVVAGEDMLPGGPPGSVIESYAVLLWDCYEHLEE